MTVTEVSIKRSTLVVVVFTALSLLGILCYSMLNYELLPKIDMLIMSVITQYPGASADEVENSVTKDIEDALSALENVRYMRSISQEGVSIIIIELNAGTNVNVSLQDAQRKVNTILYKLPTSVKTPSLASYSTEDIPILKMGVTANMEATRLYQIVKDHVKPGISKINGVGTVTIIGGHERQIRINADRSKLLAYNVPISTLYGIVNSSNMQFATGKIEGNASQYTIRLSGKVTSLDELRNLIVAKRSNGSVIRVSDIAEVVDGTAEYTSLTRINGTDAVGLQIMKQSDANSVEVCELVKKEMAKIESEYASSNLKFEIASDNSVFTLDSAKAVIEDLMIAILLVAIIMFLFLHSIRNSFIVLISIPTSLISVFTGMYIFDFSLNMMTLMGLSLVIGILVDDSIVVLENIYRHLSMGKKRKDAALEGRSEIGFTAVAITMVDVVVFLPMALVSGMIGNMLREFALVVVFSTLMSLFVSFTITPLLASRFGKIEKLTRASIPGKIALTFESLYNKLVVYYERVLRWGLNNRKKVLVGTGVLFISSFTLIAFNFIGSEFVPKSDRGEFVVTLEGEAQNTIYQTNQLTEKVEKIITRRPDVVKILSSVGYSSASMLSLGGEQHKSEITVTLVDKSKRTQTVDDYAAMVKRDILAEVPGLKVSAVPSSMFGSGDAPVQVLLTGSNMDDLYRVADKVSKLMEKVPGVDDIRLSVDKSKPEVHVELNRDKMSMLGLSVADVGSTLQMAFAGNTDLQYSDNGTDYDINIKMDQFDRKKVDDIGSITFQTKTGATVELRQFASVYQTLGPNKLERYDRISALTVKSQVVGRPVGTVGEEIKKIVSENIHEQNVTIAYKGQLERQSEAFGSLLFALGVAILLVYFVMVSLYNSYLYPFVVLFSLPVAVIGAFLALALAGQNISIFTLIGIIMLMGLVAKNAILLVDFTNKCREEGMSILDALVEAGKERLRPILMTTVAMVIGMLPLALATSASSENRNGLAWVIIGGLTSSLLLTLVLVPAVYVIMENVKTKFMRRFSKKKAGETEDEPLVLSD